MIDVEYPKKIYAILSMLGILAISSGLDRLMLSLRQYNSEFFTVTLYVILLYPLSYLVITAGGLLLFWFMTYKMNKSYLVSTVLVLIGILVELLVLDVLPHFVQPFHAIYLFLQASMSPRSNLFLTGAFMLMLGLLSLFLPHPKENK